MKSDRRSQFEQLALPLQKSLYTAALYLTHDPSLSEDLVQETYLKAYTSFSSYTPGTNLKAWMMTILRNTYLSLCRRRKLEPVELDTSETAVVHPARTESPSSGPWYSDQVQQALEKLSPRHRILVLMADVEGFTYSEIAGILNCPMGSVMSGLFNAREHLRRLLTPEPNRINSPHQAL